MSLKAHKIALRPTDAQVAWFRQQCGYARYAFNSALADFKAGLAEGEFRSFIDLNNRWNQRKKDLDWETSEQDQRAALHGVKNLSDAVHRWQKKQNGFPKFKKRGCRQAYTVEGYQCEVDGKRIKLPKIGTVKMFSELRFDGKITRVTVSRTAHRWFVSILVDTGIPNVPRDTRGLPVIGIDVGINTLATLDDGTKFENRKPLKRFERKLKREQRSLSRKVFLSQNWYKQKRIVERIHYRIACIRRDAHHKATTEIVKRASKIGIETLQVTNLLKNRKLAKALSDAALGGFLEKLRTKALSLGIPIVQADRFFASSKTCSNCGHKKDALRLSDREYHCPKCGYREDRDVNAAINLRNLAAGYAES